MTCPSDTDQRQTGDTSHLCSLVSHVLFLEKRDSSQKRERESDANAGRSLIAQQLRENGLLGGLKRQVSDSSMHWVTSCTVEDISIQDGWCGRSLVPAAGRFVLADCREANLISGERVETRCPVGAACEISPVLLRITAFGSARSLSAEMTCISRQKNWQLRKSLGCAWCVCPEQPAMRLRVSDPKHTLHYYVNVKAIYLSAFIAFIMSS